MKTDEDTIYMERDGVYEPFEIRGVNLGVGIPGHFATDYAIDEETYLRWFGYIQELGANTIRVYTLLHDDFYNAFYEYNTAREAAGRAPVAHPRGLGQRLCAVLPRDAYDDDFLQALLDDSQTLVDMLHGKRSLVLGRGLGSGSYRRDVSDWVIGYILGVEWEDVTGGLHRQQVSGAELLPGHLYGHHRRRPPPFEAMLAQVGDHIIEYETNRYRQQRLVAFSQLAHNGSLQLHPGYL